MRDNLKIYAIRYYQFVLIEQSHLLRQYTTANTSYPKHHELSIHFKDQQLSFQNS